MIKYINKIIGIAGFLFSAILIVFYSEIVFKLTNFAKIYMNEDHQETEFVHFHLKTYLILLILIVIIFSVVFFFNLSKKLFQFTSNFIKWDELKKFLLADDIYSKKRLQVVLLIVSSSYGLLLHMYFLLFGEPEHEGIIEKLSSLIFLVSGLILMISITQIKKNQFKPSLQRQVKLILTVFSGLLFFIFGEEISWGQDIFHWESSEIFETYNYQKETNSHNFFNPLFKFMYPMVGLGTFLALFFIWFFPNSKPYLLQLFIPPPSLFFIVFFMACSSYFGHNEIYEELLALFLLLHSIRIYLCLKFHNRELK